MLLAFDQLQAVNLPLNLAAALGKRQGYPHGPLVLTQASGKASQVAASGLGQPRGERIRGAGANQGIEALGKVANRGQRRRPRKQPLDIGAVRLRKRRQISREHPGHTARGI